MPESTVRSHVHQGALNENSIVKTHLLPRWPRYGLRRQAVLLTLTALDALLSEGERVRARRFCFRRDADRYVVARGILRVLLGRYLHVGPGADLLSVRSARAVEYAGQQASE